MGTLVLFLTAPVWISAVIILLVLGLKGDEWFGHPDPSRKGQYVYLHNEEGELIDIIKDKNGTIHGTICFDEDDEEDDELFDDDDDDDYYDDLDDMDEDDREEARLAFKRFKSGNYDATDIALMAEDDDIFDEFEDELQEVDADYVYSKTKII